MPDAWVELTVAAQEHDSGSSLAFHRTALAIRRESEALREGTFSWRESPPGTLLFERSDGGATVLCAVNVDGDPLELPAGEVLLASEEVGSLLPHGAAAWIRI